MQFFLTFFNIKHQCKTCSNKIDREDNICQDCILDAHAKTLGYEHYTEMRFAR